MAVVGHLCLSTEGIPSLRRALGPCHLFIPYTHFSASQVLNWFCCILLYISLFISLPAFLHPPYLKFF